MTATGRRRCRRSRIDADGVPGRRLVSARSMWHAGVTTNRACGAVTGTETGPCRGSRGVPTIVSVTRDVKSKCASVAIEQETGHEQTSRKPKRSDTDYV